MQDSVESEEQAEALVDTLHIDANTLSEANLSGLSTSDLEQLADLEAELCMDSTDIEVEGLEVKQMLDNEIVETEIGAEEVEIETEELEADQVEEPDEILPDVKHERTISVKVESSQSQGVPPPLRPLNIAPKPATSKIGMALKTALVNAGTGQQIVFIQSPGGAANTVNIGGQPIKLVSAQGQPVTLPNFQNVSLANSKSGIVQLRPANKSIVVNTSSESAVTTATQLKAPTSAVKKIIPQNKNIVAKVILGGQQQQVVLTSQAPTSDTSQTQQIKVVSTNPQITAHAIPSTAKTITLAQAQQMGLITSNKVQQIVPQSPTKTTVVSKTIQGKTIKVVPQVKSPTKILPAPAQGQKIQVPKAPQRVIIRQGQGKGGTIMGSGVNQVIRIPASQAITPGQIHQINVPGKGVQYIRFMTAASGTTTNATVTSSVPPAKALTQTTQAQKAQVVPVASIAVNRSVVNNKVTVSSNSNVIKVVPVSASQARPVAPKPVTAGQRILIPATNTQTRTGQTLTTIPASALSQIQGATILPSGNNQIGQIVMLPAQYVQQLQNQNQPAAVTSLPTPKVAVTAKSAPQKTAVKVSPSQAKETVSLGNETTSTPPESTNFTRALEPNGIRPRKPCNCTKSLCLKLYCDCFANGEFCHLCNCMNCFNNLDKEEERQRAIRNCLERNPNAFRPKIGKGRDAGESSVRKHTKGCNCKRSGCLKNYCECYEAKIACSSNCKCVGCRNIEDTMEKKNMRPLASVTEQALQVVPTAKLKQVPPAQDITTFRQLITSSNSRMPSNYITNEVIEATNQCMIAQADEAERNMLPEELAKKQILEEFGRCLVEIIECSAHAANT